VDPAGRFASVGAARLTKAGAKGSVFAFAPTFALRGTSSTKSSSAEDVARWWNAALAQSGSAGVFDVTVDGRGTVGLRVSRSVVSCV
jgi:hypothetical protein